MSSVSTGTVTVANGETLVTAWVGAGGVVLSEITSPADSQVVIEGVANFIASRVSTTSFQLALPHTGAGGTGLGCAISALTAVETQIGTLNARTARFIQDLSVLDANGRGLFYNLIGVTGAADPGPGCIAFDADNPDDVTEIYLDVLDANEYGRNVSGLIDLWSVNTTIIVRSLASTAYAAFRLTAPPASPGGWRKASVEPIDSDGMLANEPVAVEWLLAGQGLRVDRAGPYSGRAAFDTVAAPFGYISTDGAAGAGAPSVLYVKNGPTALDWSPAASYEGPRGYRGWSPVIATVSDGARRVRRLIGYFGGEGAAPIDNVGKYEGPAGYVDSPAEATDIRGAVGPAGGGGRWQMLAEDGVATNYTVSALDAGTMLAFSSPTPVTASLPAIAGAHNELYRFLNTGAGNLTVEPNAAELVDGGVSLVLPSGSAADVWPNAAGTAWRGFVYAPSDEYLSKSNNLSDLASPVVARQNLGLAWTVIYDETRSSVAAIDLINLGDYHTLRGTLFIRPSASTSINARFSDTNGASFYAGASDYINSYLYGIAGTANFQEDGASSQIRVSSTGAVGSSEQSGLKLNFEVTRFNEGGAYGWLTYDAFAYTSTSAIAKGSGGGRCEKAVSFDALRFLPGSGTIAYADILLEGRR